MESHESTSPSDGGTDAVRAAVLTAAIDTITEAGPAGLTVRRLAAAAHTSTMAVYTHYGSLGGVTATVVEYGFGMLGRAMTAAPRSGDALTDLFGIALTYLAFARARPRLYALMFAHSAPDRSPGRRTPGTPQRGEPAFTMFLTALTGAEQDSRAESGGHDAQRLALAAELWSALHGNAMLRIAGHLDTDDDTVAHSLLVALAVGNGMDRAAAHTALERARAATASTR